MTMPIGLVKADRSYRGYDHSRVVTGNELLKMVETARLCPYSVNVQPLKHTRCRCPHSNRNQMGKGPDG